MPALAATGLKHRHPLEVRGLQRGDPVAELLRMVIFEVTMDFPRGTELLHSLPCLRRRAAGSEAEGAVREGKAAVAGGAGRECAGPCGILQGAATIRTAQQRQQRLVGSWRGHERNRSRVWVWKAGHSMAFRLWRLAHPGWSAGRMRPRPRSGRRRRGSCHGGEAVFQRKKSRTAGC